MSTVCISQEVLAINAIRTAGNVMVLLQLNVLLATQGNTFSHLTTAVLPATQLAMVLQVLIVLPVILPVRLALLEHHQLAVLHVSVADISMQGIILASHVMLITMVDRDQIAWFAIYLVVDVQEFSRLNALCAGQIHICIAETIRV